MSIFKQTAKAAGDGQAIPVPTAGTHSAVLVAIVDLGSKRDKYQDSGKEYVKRSVYLCWELEDGEASDEGRRFFVGGDYNLAFGEKAKLRLLVEHWRGSKFKDGDDFDISKLLGQPCFLQITHKTTAAGRTVAQVVGASKLPKGVARIQPSNGTFLGELGPKPVELCMSLPAWLPYLYGRPLAEHIAESIEYGGNGKGARDPEPAGVAAGEAEVGDDNPF